jgi:hypothetical protein
MEWVFEVMSQIWGRILLQATAEPRDLPLLAIVVSAVALAIVVAIVAAAIIRPAPQAVSRKKPLPKTEVVIKASVAAEAPLLKKAPVKITFPQIREGFPDVWGQGEPVDIQIQLEDATLKGMSTVPGLTVKIQGVAVPVTFSKGVAKLRKNFPEKGDKPISVELQLKKEQLPRRTTRVLRIVDYREEMAEVFHKFKEEASRAVTPIRDDATPTEVYDILLDANPRLPSETIRIIIRGFEEAKFSNHAVTRASYERMIQALLELERVEL